MVLDDDIPFIDRVRLRWGDDEHSLLGEGSFGVVYKGTWDGTDVAIKVVKRPENADATDESRSKQVAAFRQHRREIHRFQAVQNPHIIQYFGVFRDADPRDLYIVTEYLAGGSLYDSLCEMRAREAVLQEQSFLTIARHIANGLNHVHSEHYSHGDMKPQNVLLTSAFQFEQLADGSEQALFPPYAKVKIADFGLSKRLEGAQDTPIQTSMVATTDFGTGPCGTFLYMAPEVYHGVSELPDADVKAADVFAYGMVLFELLSCLPCWGMERVRHIMHLQTLVIVERKRPAWGPLKPSINPSYVQLVERCWSHATNDRPTMGEIIDILEEFQSSFSARANNPTSASPTASSETLQLVEDPDDLPKIDSDEPLSPSRTLPESVLTEQPSETHPEQPGASEQIGSSDAGAGEFIHVESMRPLTHCQPETIGIPGLPSALSYEDGNNSGALAYDSISADISCPDGERPQNPVLKADEKGGQNLDSDDAANAERPHVGFIIDDKKGSSKATIVSECPKEGSESATIKQKEYEGQKPVMYAIDVMDMYGGIEGSQDSIIDGLPFTRVQSTRVLRPAEQQLEIDPDGQGVHGLGSIANNENHLTIPKRSKDAQLNSFFNAAHQNVDSSPVIYRQETSQDQGQIELEVESPKFPPSTGHIPIGRSSEMVTNNANITLSLPEPSVPNNVNIPTYSNEGISSYSTDGEEKLQADLYALSSIDPELISTAQRQDVVIPVSAYPAIYDIPQPFNQSDSIDTDDVSLRPVVSRPPELSGTYAREHFKQTGVLDQNSHQTNTYHSITAAGATAPPLSNTEQSVPLSSHSESRPPHGAQKVQNSQWQSPVPGFQTPEAAALSRMSLNPVPTQQTSPSTVDVKEVLQVLQTVNAVASIEKLWFGGHAIIVAKSLAQADFLGGEDFLKMACRYLELNNGESNIQRSDVIAKDLCVAIGKIARNDSRTIGREVVLHGLPISLSSMNLFRDNVDVFVASNFALCNLLKVHNTIDDSNLRVQLAAWINYSISWNMYHEGIQKGPRIGSLAYEAASAARNFMWLNDANVEAFVAQQYSTGKPSTIGLMSSIEYFLVGGDAVVDASLSALAMIVRVPAQRRAFLRQHGKRLLHDVQQRNAHRVAVATLVQSMVTLLDTEQVVVWQT